MTDRRRIPITTLSGPNEKVTELLRLLPYLDELRRQAMIFNDNMMSAWRRAMDDRTAADDAMVWARLQPALFAAIVVQRILRPSTKSVRKQPHHASLKESQDFADQRGRRLRALLDVSEDDAFFTVIDVRDSFEHIDERLDSLMQPDVIGFSDWYISDGDALVTPRPVGEPSTPERVGRGLRVFSPQLVRSTLKTTS